MKFLLLTLLIALSFIGMFFIFPYNNELLFFLEYILVPLVILLLTFFLYLRRNVLTQLSLVICACVVVLYIVYSIFYAPQIIKFFHDSQKTSNFKRRIKDYYTHAQKMRNISEMISYAELYHTYFPDDPWEFPNFATYLDIDTQYSIDIVKILHLIKSFRRKKKSPPPQKISESFTALTYLRLGKLDLIQKAADYTNDSQFYAANLLLTHYVKKYGHDNRSKKLEAIIQQNITNTQTSYTEQRRIQLQSQIQYLYNILLQNKVNESTISAYYQSVALGNNYPDNAQLQWIQNMYLQQLKQEIFFADEARVALLKTTKKMPVMFIENEELHQTIWTAKDVSYVNNTAYLEDIELIRIQGKTKNNGSIVWRMKSAYAKLQHNKLMLYSLEPGSIGNRNIPTLTITNNNLTQVPWYITTSVDAKEITFLHFPLNKVSLKTRSIIRYLISIPLWKKYSLFTSILYKEIIETLLNIALFIGVIYAFIKIKLFYCKKNDVPSFTHIYFWNILLACAYSLIKAYSLAFFDNAVNDTYYDAYILSAPTAIITTVACILFLIALFRTMRTMFVDIKVSRK